MPRPPPADITRPNAALKVAVSNLLRVLAADASAARCQLVNAVFRAADATLPLTQDEMEDIDCDKLVKRVARHTRDNPPVVVAAAVTKRRAASERAVKALLDTLGKLVATMHANESLYRPAGAAAGVAAAAGAILEDEAIAWQSLGFAQGDPRAVVLSTSTSPLELEAALLCAA